MPPKSSNRAPKKRAVAAPCSPNKRAKHINSQAPAASPASPSPPPPPITNALQALVSASQAPTFEAQNRESRPEDSITAPPEGSEHATVGAAAGLAEAAVENQEPEDEAFNDELIDNYDGLDWSRLPKFMKPISTCKYKKSWVYRHGYRVALRRDPSVIFWICYLCHRYEATDYGRGIYNTTKAPTAASRHLEDKKVGHCIYKPGTTPKARTAATTAIGKLLAGQQRVSDDAGHGIPSSTTSMTVTSTYLHAPVAPSAQDTNTDTTTFSPLNHSLSATTHRVVPTPTANTNLTSTDQVSSTTRFENLMKKKAAQKSLKAQFTAMEAQFRQEKDRADTAEKDVASLKAEKASLAETLQALEGKLRTTELMLVETQRKVELLNRELDMLDEDDSGDEGIGDGSRKSMTEGIDDEVERKRMRG